MWEDHLVGKETSFNPLGMVKALIGAMQHAATLDGTNKDEVFKFTLMVGLPPLLPPPPQLPPPRPPPPRPLRDLTRATANPIEIETIFRR